MVCAIWGFWIEGGFRLQASGFRLQASGFRLQASGFRLQNCHTVNRSSVVSRGARRQARPSGGHDGEHEANEAGNAYKMAADSNELTADMARFSRLDAVPDAPGV
jgi:hypothetical protein